MSIFAMTGLSDTGRLRRLNEDRFLIDPPRGLAILADGMGGHLAGEVASTLAIEVIHRELAQSLDGTPARRGAAASEIEALQQALDRANRAIYDTSRQHPEYRGMGTTVVVGLWRGGRLCLAHVGDSRLYRLRRGRLVQLTEDHSFVQEMIRDGRMSAEEARLSANRALVTRALGVDPAVEADYDEQAVRAGDVFLLCSDGLNDVLRDPEIERVLVACGGDLGAAARDLVQQANARGGPDNITVVLVEAPAAPARRPRRARRRDA
jgi:protein phosphatase